MSVKTKHRRTPLRLTYHCSTCGRILKKMAMDDPVCPRCRKARRRREAQP